MTEYAHNHPPRCCCPAFKFDGPRSEVADPCPLCTEHGELAQLAYTRTIDSARITAATIDGRPALSDLREAALDAALTGSGYLLDGKRVPPEDVTIVHAPDCSTCHQPHGRPHTDYCHAAGTIVGADPRANPLGMTFEATHHANGSDMHPRHECHPDRCGMWATQTTQPATTTSVPTTQHRDPADLVGRLRDAVDQAKARRQADQVTEDNKGQRWHETGPDEAHETWRCSPPKCGREPTPLGTPTPPPDCEACAAADIGVMPGLPHTCGQ